MSIDIDKAYSVDDDGFAIKDDDGNSLLYITAGSGAPTGSAPINTWYFDKDAQIMYYKYGLLDTDWRQLRAQDITVLDNQAAQVTLQFLLDNLQTGQTSSVSQTIIFGDGGNSSANSYLPNQGVQSNVVGVPVGLANASIRSIYINNQNIRTGDIEIYQDGVLLYTVTLNGTNKASFKGLSVSVNEDSELSCRTRVSLKNSKVVLNINGDSA